MTSSREGPLPRSDDRENERLVAGFLAGDAAAADALSVVLDRHAAVTARAFLGDDCAEAQDIAQDGVVAVLTWLRRRGRFRGSIVNFTVTVVRNRCRNYVLWLGRQPGVDLDQYADYLGDPNLGPLDLVLSRERNDLAREAVASLGEVCRRLLSAFYGENRSAEQIRRESGLGSVQAVYHRRRVCLQKAAEFLRKRLLDCSYEGSGGRGSPADRQASRRES